MREAFQEILLRFSLCGLAASLALLALRARSFRAACETLLGLWRGMTALGRTVAVLFVSVFVVYASTKTNTPPLRVVCPLSLPRLESPTVTAADIDRGYRQVSVATNEDASFAMPSNATIIGNWHKRGTFGEWMRLDFGDFAFPLGTNGAAYSAFSVFSDGKIRPTPRDTAHEICAVGSPLLALQGESRFWTAEGANDSKILTWENFFLNADTNAPVNAQIELSTAGDFTVRTNAVATAYARICPQDWDGDGRANEIDPDSFVCDGDWFGVANAIPAGGNTNAYYWLDISVTGRLDCAAIRVTCDGPSDLGNQVIIARTGQTCHVPLLAGASYAVESDLPVASVAASSAHAEVWTNSETSLVVELPLELSFTRSDAGGGTCDYIAHTTPVDVAPGIHTITGGCCSCVTNGLGFFWTCFPQCLCGGSEHQLSGVAKWEGYSYPFSWMGRCHCYYEDQFAIDEIESRGVSLVILDASGNAIEWQNPVLVGESVVVKAIVGGSEMTVADFVGLFGGRIKLKVYYADFSGAHDIAVATVPISESTTIAHGPNVFHLSVAAAWLQSNGIVRNAEDGVETKTSIDMSDAPTGESSRQDSDIFDSQVAGRLYGRARGERLGNASASIPEGSLNLKTFQAGGTGIMVATCGSVLSDKCQVQQQADIIFYSGHGGHESAMLVGGVHPSLLNFYWTNVEAVVLSGCAVLDISNFRQQSFGWKTSLRWRMHGGANSPGEAWESLDVGVLLGFAWTAPLDSAGGVDVAQGFASALSTGKGLIEAWREATDSDATRNACAIDRTAVPHVYWFWDEQSGVPIWTNAVKTAKGWEKR